MPVQFKLTCLVRSPRKIQARALVSKLKAESDKEVEKENHNPCYSGSAMWERSAKWSGVQRYGPRYASKNGPPNKRPSDDPAWHNGKPRKELSTTKREMRASERCSRASRTQPSANESLHFSPKDATVSPFPRYRGLFAPLILSSGMRKRQSKLATATPTTDKSQDSSDSSKNDVSSPVQPLVLPEISQFEHPVTLDQDLSIGALLPDIEASALAITPGSHGEVAIVNHSSDPFWGFPPTRGDPKFLFALAGYAKSPSASTSSSGTTPSSDASEDYPRDIYEKEDSLWSSGKSSWWPTWSPGHCLSPGAWRNLRARLFSLGDMSINTTNPILLQQIQMSYTSHFTFADDANLTVNEIQIVKAGKQIYRRFGYTIEHLKNGWPSRFYRPGDSDLFARTTGAELSMMVFSKIPAAGISTLSDYEISLLPPDFQPTALQRTVPHHPVLDIMPWASVRDNLLTVLSTVINVQSSSIRDGHKISLPFSFHQLIVDVQDIDGPAEGMHVFGDPFVADNWEIGQKMLERWWWAFDDRVIRQSNRWRRKRGVPPLSLSGNRVIVE
jgi:hypothetical protein